MANAGDACTAAKATFPMLSLNVKPKVFCAVLRARCACNPWLTSKGQGHKKSDFKRGNWGQGLEPFCSESDYSALVRRQERRKIQISARENTSTGFTINAPTVDHNRNIFTPSDCASFTRSPSLPRLLMETRFWICNVTGYSC